jgi:hypothetical protein
VLPYQGASCLRESNSSAVGRITIVARGKVGGTGTRPVPGEMENEEDWKGSAMSAEGQRLVRPQSRGLRAVFGRLANLRFTMLPLCRKIGAHETPAVPWITPDSTV